MKYCKDCLYARIIPKPEIKTITTISFLWGVEQDLADDLYYSQMENHLNRIKCHRYPETILKDKESFCGEYKDISYYEKHP